MDLPRIGFQVWSQFTSWPELAATAIDIERLGFDSLWSNDHFFPAAGDAAASPGGLAGPVFEGWMTLAGFAQVTNRIPLGVLVSGAGYRNPALLLKMATTLDHISGGRMSLGLGAGWHQRDHAAYGFTLGEVRDRLDRLDEQSAVIRALLHGREVTVSGRWVQVERVQNDPEPVGSLPLMIGGSGERRTLRIVARYADVWNGEGDPETVAHKIQVLHGYCRDLGRDPDTIRITVGVPPIRIRSRRDDAVASLASALMRNGLTPSEAQRLAEADPLAGPPEILLQRLAAYREVGVDELIPDWPPPYDRETLERLADARS
jgi:alkanesulfonate monooxygenase SsuD/methylene tetrahydromethanopterin reductase-like flavin-dependent oxidoreductase (luciferase family)